MAAGTRLGSWIVSSATKHVPSAKSADISSATAMHRRVLPTPAGPVMVTRRAPSRAIRSRMCARSRSRSTRRVGDIGSVAGCVRSGFNLPRIVRMGDASIAELADLSTRARVNRPIGPQPVAQRVAHGINSTAGADLGVDVDRVLLHRTRADDERGCNLLVTAACCKEPQDLNFAWREFLMTSHANVVGGARSQVKRTVVRGSHPHLAELGNGEVEQLARSRPSCSAAAVPAAPPAPATRARPRGGADRAGRGQRLLVSSRASRRLPPARRRAKVASDGRQRPVHGRARREHRQPRQELLARGAILESTPPAPAARRRARQSSHLTRRVLAGLAPAHEALAEPDDAGSPRPMRR